MYGLDINFLKERPEYRSQTVDRRRPRGGAAAPESRQPLILGLLTGLVLVGLSAGAWLFLQSQNAALRDRQAQLDARLGTLKAEQAKLTQITNQTKQIKEETAALAGVFNTIKPWSATFNDISSRTPPKVRIVQIRELPPNEVPVDRSSPSPSPSPGAAAAPAPPPSGVIQISGTATSFNDVNDFLLVLQKSKFLKPEKTRIVKAELGQPRSPQPIQVGGGAPAARDKIKLPAEVEFTIQTVLNDVPASELLQELESKKATGLVTRIEALQQKGVVKP
ncbi:PilN domain-containing protein [Leptodesmis sichuanensis]|uniref:PilN domain-containing protein n=1 Tax=Leptodesmis sichuanensis TaxID=2906798 RepID=UPI001F37712E|nr:PilN domain-containing protein [Leptodesmis sichuanensis]UIE37950.1 PilN domain-containing protein [Leptodesmis sichuanensis A121]